MTFNLKLITSAIVAGVLLCADVNGCDSTYNPYDSFVNNYGDSNTVYRIDRSRYRVIQRPYYIFRTDTIIIFITPKQERIAENEAYTRLLGIYNATMVAP